ncbi:nicotinamide-nucleotide adenylyltransferase [Chloroflexota bacterium]
MSVEDSALYISRFRLFHKGYLGVVRYILRENRYIIIVIGAAQQPPCWDNPFSGKERAAMIVQTLSHEGLVKRAKVVQIDETGIAYDEWASLVESICPHFDMIFSNSELVRLLLGKSGHRSKSVPLFPSKEYSFDYLRERMVRSLNWEDFVPRPVVIFIKEHRLDERVIKLSSRYKNPYQAEKCDEP